MREFTVNGNDSGQRLDKFISKLMPKLPPSMMYKGLRKNCVKVNGKHVKNGAVQVSEGDEIALYFRDEFFEPEPEFRYVKPVLDIVYEDENIMIINKAVGVVVHSDDRGTKATLIEMVQSYLYERGMYDPVSENTFKPALCNRLDRNTGGLIIAACNAEALRSMNEQIRAHRVKKSYTAVVEGYPPESGELRGYSERSSKVTQISSEQTDQSKQVSLEYSVRAKKNGYALVDIVLHTGRTHQIRAQFSAEGYPLAGDTKYGGHGGVFRQALWSTGISFDFKGSGGILDYLDGKTFKVEAPFEREF